MEPTRAPATEDRAGVLRAVLDATRAIAAHRSLADLVGELAERLNPIVGSDFLLLVLKDPDRETMSLRVVSGPGSLRERWPTSRAVEQSPGGLAWRTQEPFLLVTERGDARFTEPVPLLRESGVRWVWFFPLTT